MSRLQKRYKLLTNSQIFGLAVGGVLTESNHDSFDSLHLSYGKSACRKSLSNSWGINSTEDLSEMINWLFTEGHRTSFLKFAQDVYKQNRENNELDKASLFVKNNFNSIKTLGLLTWDLSRVVNLARTGFVAGYISEEQAWVFIMKAASLVQNNYSCWEDTGKSFMLGYQIWAFQFEDMPTINHAYTRLLKSKNSIWKQIDWNSNLQHSKESNIVNWIKNPTPEKRYCKLKLVCGLVLGTGLSFFMYTTNPDRNSLVITLAPFIISLIYAVFLLWHLKRIEESEEQYIYHEYQLMLDSRGTPLPLYRKCLRFLEIFTIPIVIFEYFFPFLSLDVLYETVGKNSTILIICLLSVFLQKGFKRKIINIEKSL